MSSELYIPNITGKPGTEFYRYSERFRRHSEASKKKASKWWASIAPADRFVDTKQAKPVAVYRMDGTFIGWWPSARKAAIALFPANDTRSMERGIRACRQNRCGKWAKRSFHGYMFRDWKGDTSSIEPYVVARKKTHPRGYKKCNPHLNKPCECDWGDGDPIRFASIKECATAINGTRSGIWLAMKEGRKYKGKTIKLL